MQQVKIPSEVLSELKVILSQDEKLLGTIFNLYEKGLTNAQELASKSGAANRGVVYNNLNILKSILMGEMPTGASISRQSIRAIDRLIKNNQISTNLLNYFDNLRRALQENSENLSAVNHDREMLEKSSDLLSEKASNFKHAIYVYSFPTYLHYGTIEDPDLIWLKIGSTRNSVWQRIVEQNRQTSMPEDPKLLRIYHKDGMDLSIYEKKFHDTLEKVGHERSAASRSKAGREWFATTLNALDALAELMELRIESELNFEDI
jgi:T5orf172 domain